MERYAIFQGWKNLYCEMTTKVELVNTSITSDSYHFLFVVRFKIYFVSKFQVYNTVLLTIITILYNRFPELIHFITGNLHSLTNVSPFTPLPQALATRGLLSACTCSTSLVSTVFLCLAYFA